MAQRLAVIDTHLGPQNQNLMLKWRQEYPLSRKEVRNLIYGEKYANLIDQCFDVIIKNRHIFEHADVEEFTKQKERQQAAKMVLTYHKLRPFQAPRYFQDPHSLTMTAHASYNFDPGLSVKTDISIFLYGKTIYNYGSKDSKLHKQLFERALTLKDIGCFGLTEFGHGSNVKNIQTEAVYDHKTKQFVLTMPNKEAMKFWIGAAAQLANMGAIWAQLILDGVKYGPHPFVVPLRDPKNLQLLPGVTVGDCGHKNGCNNIDNGYILLDHVRIPKQYALDGLSGVNDEGKFWSKIENAQKRFGLYMNPLSFGRSFVSINSVTSAASALAIAIRYTSQRRQFVGPKQTEQRIILEYPLTKHRLMPLLAKCYIYFFGGINILRLYDQHMKDLLDPKNKLVNQMHAVSGIAKAQSSWFTIHTITECRELLGGHGYSAYSRLGRLFNDNDINTTWQGDNHMLLQQTTKYILKTASKVQRGKIFDESILLFLKDQIQLPQTFTVQDFDCLNLLEKILQQRIQIMVNQTMGYMFKLKGENLKDMDVWNYAQPYHGKKMAFLFGDLYYFGIIKAKLGSMSSQLRKITEQCIKLWVLDTLERERWGTYSIRKTMQEKINELCEWLTPRSVSLIDSFVAPSQIIGSPFADEEGQGMKKYLNLLYSGKNTFRRVDWYENIIKHKKQINAKEKN